MQLTRSLTRSSARLWPAIEYRLQGLARSKGLNDLHVTLVTLKLASVSA